jgi:peptidoglycan/xylan/chitin deacetylase (PgdA/CDA1 family)
MNLARSRYIPRQVSERKCFAKVLIVGTTALLSISIAVLGGHSAQAATNGCQPATLTFDDGPDNTSPSVLNALNANGLHAIFFVIGDQVAGDQQQVQAEYASGDLVENHTWDHASFTGQSTGTAHLTQNQITNELSQAQAAIVAAGLPAPTMYRPAYGDDDAWSDLIARNMGLQLVESYSASSTPEAGSIVDSKDWTGISTAQIVSNVEAGLAAASANGISQPVVAMHDTIPATAQAIPAIAQWMSANNWCSMTALRTDATGGVVPQAPTPEPTTGNLVVNPGMETLWSPGNSGGFPQTIPYCWMTAGYGSPGPNAQFSAVNDPADPDGGHVAMNITVSGWASGDSKVVIAQRGKSTGTGAACTPQSAAVPGATYTLWEWYKGSWSGYGLSTDPTKVSFAVYYRDTSDVWHYWTGSPLLAPSSSWVLANYTTPPLPVGATGVSFGLAIQGNGSLTVDDAAMIHS